MKRYMKQLPTLSEYMQLPPGKQRYYYNKYTEYNYPEPPRMRRKYTHKKPTLSEYMQLPRGKQRYYYNKYLNYPELPPLPPKQLPTLSEYMEFTHGKQRYYYRKYPEQYYSNPYKSVRLRDNKNLTNSLLKSF